MKLCAPVCVDLAVVHRLCILLLLMLYLTVLVVSLLIQSTLGRLMCACVHTHSSSNSSVQYVKHMSTYDTALVYYHIAFAAMCAAAQQQFSRNSNVF
jgi:hypothetical protein